MTGVLRKQRRAAAPRRRQLRPPPDACAPAGLGYTGCSSPCCLLGVCMPVIVSGVHARMPRWCVGSCSAQPWRRTRGRCMCVFVRAAAAACVLSRVLVCARTACVFFACCGAHAHARALFAAPAALSCMGAPCINKQLARDAVSLHRFSCAALTGRHMGRLSTGRCAQGALARLPAAARAAARPVAILGRSDMLRCSFCPPRRHAPPRVCWPHQHKQPGCSACQRRPPAVWRGRAACQAFCGCAGPAGARAGCCCRPGCLSFWRPRLFLTAAFDQPLDPTLWLLETQHT